MRKNIAQTMIVVAPVANEAHRMLMSENPPADWLMEFCLLRILSMHPLQPLELAEFLCVGVARAGAHDEEQHSSFSFSF